jgi:hypothetical protein
MHKHVFFFVGTNRRNTRENLSKAADDGTFSDAFNFGQLGSCFTKMKSQEMATNQIKCDDW